ncbi:NAD(P)H-dependent FMN reductase [Parapedobacter luteus]|uniref:NAD(P)H-dependent FMN reductase n=1 Tax=Parapedobacter luteus TaxID=623280 RepID=A0A1T5AR68_9SPHI|nr:NAD(P)H-dependent oxidoreductase [Parapedobacter luteus]SKB37406.1 NAD(P)H-dependent FMN reductase [Parapedobacter luteus]
MMAYNIAVYVGSLRKASFSRKMAKALIALAPESLQLEIMDISKLPMYNEDLDESPPEEWVLFRKQLKDCDGILFVTPEYNRTIPGVLKNALDVGSRPYGESSWDGKPAAVVSVSPSAIGAFGANHHLRQALAYLNVPAMAQPEAYVGHANELFDEDGSLTNAATIEFLRDFMRAFADWVATIKG